MKCIEWYNRSMEIFVVCVIKLLHASKEGSPAYKSRRMAANPPLQPVSG